MNSGLSKNLIYNIVHSPTQVLVGHQHLIKHSLSWVSFQHEHRELGVFTYSKFKTKLSMTAYNLVSWSFHKCKTR